MSHVHELVDDYLHGLLSPAEAEAVEQHCEGCPSCQGALGEAQKRCDALKTIPPSEAGEDLVRHTLEKIAMHVTKRSQGWKYFGWSVLLATAASVLQPATSRLPVAATVNNVSLGGAGTQPIGASVLSPGQTQGSVLTAGALSNGQTGTVTVTPSGTPAAGIVNGSSALGNVTAGTHNLVTGANPLIGASVASPTQNQGSLLGVGAASNGQPVSVSAGNTPVTASPRKSILTPQGH